MLKIGNVPESLEARWHRKGEVSTPIPDGLREFSNL